VVDFGKAEVRKRFRIPVRLLTLLLSRRPHPPLICAYRASRLVFGEQAKLGCIVCPLPSGNFKG
jgi:hypothetical protein